MPGISERKLILLIGAVQFINVLDFVMVMPLGPDFAKALSIPAHHLGWVGGSYTAAAAVSGLIGALFLDRYDRRRVLAIALAGLVAGTVAGGFARDLPTLLAARVIAGAFGGPATAIALAILSDGIPPERRGRAMGAVMGAFSVASVLGIPAGLELARLGSWRAPFFTVGALGAIVAATVVALLPPQTAHLAGERRAPTPFRQVLGSPVVLLALACTAVAVIANFAIIPNISAYLQFNLGYPRARLGLLYLAGGLVSFGTMRLAGWMSDRYGSLVVASGGSVLFIGVLAFGFIHPIAAIPVVVIFVGFMVSGGFRFVPLQALTSRVPAPSERGRFMSAVSAVQHFASAAGAILGAQFLGELPSGALIGMDDLAWFAVGTSIAFPILIFLVERLVRARERAQPVAPAAAVAEPVVAA